MVYYLGKDVQVYITTETDAAGVKVEGACKVDTGTDTTAFFAHKLVAGSLTTSGNNVSDLTGVDIGIDATDEDISYVGRSNILKAEIKKYTTISLTRKKSNAQWDIIFGGPVFNTHEYNDGELDNGARWGVSYRASGGGASTAYLISNGLISPSEHGEAAGTDITYGYRVHVQLKSGGQWISIPGCCVSGHTVSINGDGTSEETLEFMSYVDIKSHASAGVVTALAAADM